VWCACPKDDEGEFYDLETGQCKAGESYELLRKKSKLQRRRK